MALDRRPAPGRYSESMNATRKTCALGWWWRHSTEWALVA
jgi:hypothetical protein